MRPLAADDRRRDDRASLRLEFEDGPSGRGIVGLGGAGFRFGRCGGRIRWRGGFGFFLSGALTLLKLLDGVPALLLGDFAIDFTGEVVAGAAFGERLISGMRFRMWPPATKRG